MKGHITIFDNKTGEIKADTDNTTVTLGRNLSADRWRGRANVSGLSTTNCYCGVGYSGNTTVAAMSGLVFEAPAGSIGRTLVTSTSRAANGSNLIVDTRFYTSGALGPLLEAGLFSTGYSTDEVTVLPVSAVADSGCMFARGTFSVYNKLSSDDITVRWTITL